MSRQILWGLFAIVACGPSIGYSEFPKLFRGQSPTTPKAAPVTSTAVVEATGPIIGTAPGYGERPKAHSHHDFNPYTGFRDNHFGYEGGFYAGPEGYYTEHKNRRYTTTAAGGACDACQSGTACPQDGCRHCGRGCGRHHGHPHHYQSYGYDWPKNMVYPTTGVPAGLVQYPYYTLRGPTDFFMK